MQWQAQLTCYRPTTTPAGVYRNLTVRKRERVHIVALVQLNELVAKSLNRRTKEQYPYEKQSTEKLNMQRKIQINLTQTAAKCQTNSHKSNEKLWQHLHWGFPIAPRQQ